MPLCPTCSLPMDAAYGCIRCQVGKFSMANPDEMHDAWDEHCKAIEAERDKIAAEIVRSRRAVDYLDVEVVEGRAENSRLLASLKEMENRAIEAESKIKNYEDEYLLIKMSAADACNDIERLVQVMADAAHRLPSGHPVAKILEDAAISCDVQKECGCNVVIRDCPHQVCPPNPSGQPAGEARSDAPRC